MSSAGRMNSPTTSPPRPHGSTLILACPRTCALVASALYSPPDSLRRLLESRPRKLRPYESRRTPCTSPDFRQAILRGLATALYSWMRGLQAKLASPTGSDQAPDQISTT